MNIDWIYMMKSEKIDGMLRNWGRSNNIVRYYISIVLIFATNNNKQAKQTTLMRNNLVFKTNSKTQQLELIMLSIEITGKNFFFLFNSDSFP